MKINDILTARGVMSAPCVPSIVDIRVLDSALSTNTSLRELAEQGAPEGTVIAARRQSGGRGRMGRSFISPDGGLYLSLLLRPTEGYDILSLTPAAAVAVCEAIASLTPEPASIKWVNDVLMRGRKVCGILTEGAVTGGRLDFVVVGAGINLYEPEGGFDPLIAEKAGYVLDERRDGAMNQLAAVFLGAFLRLYREGGAAVEYRRLCVTPGRDINVLSNGKSRPARALYIDDACRLAVRYPDGSEELLSSGEISSGEISSGEISSGENV